MTPEAAITFLDEAVRYFERHPTGGEDSAHWSNVYNAKNCREIADLIRDASGTEARQGGDGLSGSVHDGPAPKADAQKGDDHAS